MASPAPEQQRDTEVRHALTRAAEGNLEAYGWLVARFTPLLLASARRRHLKSFRAALDPEDVVQDVWVRSLPHLTKLDTRGRPAHLALLGYLTVAIANRYRDLALKAARDLPLTVENDPIDNATAQTTGVVSKAARNEQCDQLREALEDLDGVDRDIVVLRGIDQLPADAVASILNMRPNTVSKRYQRVLPKLRRRLPASLRDLFRDGRDGDDA